MKQEAIQNFLNLPGLGGVALLNGRSRPYFHGFRQSLNVPINAKPLPKAFSKSSTPLLPTSKALNFASVSIRFLFTSLTMG